MASKTVAPMYDASVPAFSAMLTNLLNCLAMGEANAKQRGIDPQVFLNARLAPDMFTLTRQVQIATDTAKGAAHRLASLEVPSLADNETSFAELKARIKKVQAMLKGMKAKDFAGAETREVTIQRRTGKVKLQGGQYLHRYALPNFYFHVTTAYAILRQNGVPLGKPDFLGKL